MKRMAILIIVFILIFPIVYSASNCNETRVIVHANQSMTSSDFNETVTRTCEPERDKSASIAVIMFFSLITFILLLLPFIQKKFSNNTILNEILRRSCWIIGLFLLSLDTAMVSTISDNAGFGLSQEIFRYLFLINWAVYLLIMFTVIQFFFRILKLWKVEKYETRTGLEYGQEK